MKKRKGNARARRKENRRNLSHQSTRTPKTERLQKQADHKKSHERVPYYRSPWFLVFALALAGALLDGVLGVIPGSDQWKLIGYRWAITTLSQRKSSVVLLNENTYLRDVDDPEDAVSKNWTPIIDNWKDTETVVRGLRRAGATAIVLDYELALQDKYMAPKGVKSLDGYFMDEMVSEPARGEYRRMLKLFVDRTPQEAPVFFAADNLQERIESQDSKLVSQPFPIDGAALLAAYAIAPEEKVGEFLATSESTVPGRHRLPTIADAVAEFFHSPYPSTSLPGFSAIARELEAEAERDLDESGEKREDRRWRQFWIDFGLVDQHPVNFPGLANLGDPAFRQAVNGKVVIIGDEKYERGDSFVLPGKGDTPGYFHQASAIATRLGTPICSPVNPFVEGLYVFLVSLTLGLVSLGIAHAVIWASAFPHDSRQAQMTEVGCDALFLLLAIFGSTWLATNLGVHHLLLPMLPVVIVVRIAELFFLLRNRIAYPSIEPERKEKAKS